MTTVSAITRIRSALATRAWLALALALSALSACGASGSTARGAYQLDRIPADLLPHIQLFSDTNNAGTRFLDVYGVCMLCPNVREPSTLAFNVNVINGNGTVDLFERHTAADPVTIEVTHDQGRIVSAERLGFWSARDADGPFLTWLPCGRTYRDMEFTITPTQVTIAGSSFPIPRTARYLILSSFSDAPERSDGRRQRLGYTLERKARIIGFWFDEFRFSDDPPATYVVVEEGKPPRTISHPGQSDDR